MTIYGLYGRTHGWGRLLTVMSPDGAAALRALIDADEDLEIKADPGQLIQLHEKRGGALARLVAANGIVVLEKAAWDAKKAALGDSVF